LIEKEVDYIVHCGDIAHTKTQISPEFVDMARDFFSNLADIAPTYIILGNHDGNLRNSSRQDALTPIIRAINHPDLHLLKDSCRVRLGSEFVLNVLSVFDEENWPEPSSSQDIDIALYHGAIDKSKTDSDWTLGGDHSISIFDNFDFAFLGDIHKTQKLDAEGRIWYAGSTIQQNFGESLDKGYLLWDIEDKDTFTNELITFNNPKPFITISLTPRGNLPRSITVPDGARVRIVSENNISLDKMRKAIDVLKFKYSPESVTYLSRAANKKLSLESDPDLEQKDLRDISVQETLIKEYLKDYEASDTVMKTVFDLNKKYNTLIEEGEDVYRNINWSLKSLEWDYLFNYGEGNRINFDRLEGIVGIFGKNFSGKSSIVDSLLYTMFNSTSKSIRKNLNIINQNQEVGFGRATLEIDGDQYLVERISEKYVKRLKGEETLEAKTDLEFAVVDLAGEVVELNGTSRQDTDKNIRKYFGSLDDFLMTSMASQLDSLTFINEGSTKRKEILAKFLDLEIFEKKYKMAKEDSSVASAALRRIGERDFDKEIEDTKRKILRSEIRIETNKSICASLKEVIRDLNQVLTEVQTQINSVPAEIIDIVDVNDQIQKSSNIIKNLKLKQYDINKSIENNGLTYQKIEAFVDSFDVESYIKEKEYYTKKSEELKVLISDLSKESENLTRYQKKERLLSEVPCGSEYSNCKFIKDAYENLKLIPISEANTRDITMNINEVDLELQKIDYNKIDRHLANYNDILNKKNRVATELADDQISLEKIKNEIIKQEVVLSGLKSKKDEYDKNKESIENLENLFLRRKEIKDDIFSKEIEHDRCNDDVLTLYKTHGSLEEKLNSLESQRDEYELLRTEFAAYDLLMKCSHPNGISYDIIKKRLPIINQEIAKILANIVDFEIFIQNDDKKLDIFIKHPRHGARPLEMGSGAEKTIASMAIRLAFLTVSSLPKSDLFILDEPGTALDEENMEGFVRILDMVKSYFKTVMLISHLDNLKDCVDMQINIEKNGSYASVNV